MRMLHEAMDTTSRSIAAKNLRLCLANRKDILFLKFVAKSPALRSEKAKNELKKWLKRWSNWWEKEKEILVILDVTMTEAASKSVIGILENAGKRGYDEEETMK